MVSPDPHFTDELEGQNQRKIQNCQTSQNVPKPFQTLRLLMKLKLLSLILGEGIIGEHNVSQHIYYEKTISIFPQSLYGVLKKHHVKPMVKRRKKSDYKLYNKEIPCDRVQLDMSKLAPGVYQFTAIDDCTRMKVIRVYPNKKAENTIHFLGEIMDTF